MINLGFFPSRHLAFYMVRLFLTRSLAVLFALVLVLMTLDLLGEAGKILAVPGNGDSALWHYVALRIPLLISRFLPFSVLLGTLIAFVALNQNSEVVAMKAAGLSAHQILAPLIVASIAIAGLLFAFNEGVVVNSARVVDAWSDNDYKPVPPSSGLVSNVWLLQGDDLIRVGIISGQGSGMTLHDVSIYDRSGGVPAQCRNVRRQSERRAPFRADEGACGHHRRSAHACQGRPDRARLLDPKGPNCGARSRWPPDRRGPRWPGA
jgi:lipopolysaccharide export system permease protein